MTPPPEFKPYTIPTFDGTEPAVNAHIDALTAAPKINADTVFQRVLACYPHKSKWAIDVELRGSLSSATVLSETGSSLGKNYVQIVGAMPLYSSSEMDRAIKNEHDMRQETAQTVAKFIKAIADRNTALRQLSLYESLEKRAAVRVKAGVVSADEQVKYLEKVAVAHEAVIAYEADIMSSRIALAAMCSGKNYQQINMYLKMLGTAPK